MIVVDASALVALVGNTPAGSVVADRCRRAVAIHAPQLAAIESVHAVRRQFLHGDIDAERGRQQLQHLTEIPYERHGHEVLLDRIWELRGNLSAYDATYVALAEALRAPLLTLDAKLAASPGHRATIELVTQTGCAT